MAINKNHEFEELNGIKCAIVEKNVPPQRVEFLKNLLQFNGYEVVVAASPAPKAAPAPKPAAPANGEAQPEQPAPPPPPPAPETFTVGVTDITFNPINAIFGRALRTPDRHIVTLAYWQQKEEVSHDEVPYFESPPVPGGGT
ncbi:MAG TPA: hypothetical protein VL095_00280 [Flavisolibacter sp.]|nr:hypothetical protein [Flavisolibacter sp.]